MPSLLVVTGLRHAVGRTGLTTMASPLKMLPPTAQHRLYGAAARCNPAVYVAPPRRYRERMHRTAIVVVPVLRGEPGPIVV
jgi:hypothetical protein